MDVREAVAELAGEDRDGWGAPAGVVAGGPGAAHPGRGPAAGPAARLARDHDRTGKALAMGDISRAQVEVLATTVRRLEDLFADHEDVLLDAAEALRPEDFRAAARRWRCLADDRAAREDAHEGFRRRHLHASAGFGGTVVGDFELDPEGGATVIAALEARDRPDPTDTAGGPRTRSQRWADLLVEVMGESLAAANATRRAAGRAPAGVDVSIDLDTLVGRPPADLTTVRCDLAGVGPVARDTALRLACDAGSAGS